MGGGYARSGAALADARNNNHGIPKQTVPRVTMIGREGGVPCVCEVMNEWIGKPDSVLVRSQSTTLAVGLHGAALSIERS